MRHSIAIFPTSLAMLSMLVMGVAGNATAAGVQIDRIAATRCVPVPSGLPAQPIGEVRRPWSVTNDDAEGCYMGFPWPDRQSALIQVNGMQMEMFPDTKSDRPESYRSLDGRVTLQVRRVGEARVCEPPSATCCGITRYATITVKQGGRRNSVKAAQNPAAGDCN